MVLRGDAVSGRKNQVAGIYFNKTQGTPFYTPDLIGRLPQGVVEEPGGRVDVAGLAEEQGERASPTPSTYQVRGAGDNAAPEAQTGWSFWPARAVSGDLELAGDATGSCSRRARR